MIEELTLLIPMAIMILGSYYLYKQVQNKASEEYVKKSVKKMLIKHDDITSVALALGVPEHILAEWVKEADISSYYLSSEQDQINVIRAELASLSLEVTVLKSRIKV